MAEFFRRASDAFKHQPRKDSVESTKSSKSKSPEQTLSNSRSASTQSDAPVGATPERRKSRRWSIGRQLDEETLKKRRESQEEKDRAFFAAARKYDRARRRSQGAGIGFEGGWQ